MKYQDEQLVDVCKAVFVSLPNENKKNQAEAVSRALEAEGVQEQYSIGVILKALDLARTEIVSEWLETDIPENIDAYISRFIGTCKNQFNTGVKVTTFKTIIQEKTYE